MRDIIGLYNSGTKVIALREDGTRERYWIEYGEDIKNLDREVHEALEYCLSHPMETVDVKKAH